MKYRGPEGLTGAAILNLVGAACVLRDRCKNKKGVIAKRRHGNRSLLPPMLLACIFRAANLHLSLTALCICCWNASSTNIGSDCSKCALSRVDAQNGLWCLQIITYKIAEISAVHGPKCKKVEAVVKWYIVGF